MSQKKNINELKAISRCDHFDFVFFVIIFHVVLEIAFHPKGQK